FAASRRFFVTIETRGTSRERDGIVPLHEEILRRVRALPGVARAGMSTLAPQYGGRNRTMSFAVPRGDDTRDRDPSVLLTAVTPGYFATAGIRLDRGRDFTESD